VTETTSAAPWRGVLVATALPLRPSGADPLAVDLDGYADHLRWLAANGCDGVVPKPTAVTPSWGPASLPAPAGGTVLASSARCDGRTYCSQMMSCAEATWFLKNCPGVKMDGNRDGVPCEQQWCNKR